MKKLYFAPTLEVVNIKGDAVMQNYSNSTQASDNAVSLGKGGMTPVSEDNANSIWED